MIHNLDIIPKFLSVCPCCVDNRIIIIVYQFSHEIMKYSKCLSYHSSLLCKPKKFTLLIIQRSQSIMIKWMDFLANSEILIKGIVSLL